jgi:HD superfamily phosphohydrolase
MPKITEEFKAHARDLFNIHKNVLSQKIREDLSKNGRTIEDVINLYISYLESKETKSFKDEIIDPLYDIIDITEPIDRILRLPIVNRLRFIRQLSFSYVSYPAANHSRFEHSIGVYHLAKKLSEIAPVNKLLNEDLKKGFLIAALLHDLGQGPGSHSIEKIFGKKYDEKNNVLLIDDKKFGLRKELDSEVRSLVKKIIPGGEPPSEGEPVFKFFREALDSEVDIDRLDYLNRDSYFCGLKTGKVDSLMILRSIKPYKDSKGWWYSFSDNPRGIEFINATISARRELYPLVYQEEKRLAADEAYTHALVAFCYQWDPSRWMKLANRTLLLNDYQIMSLMMGFGDDYVREFVYNAFNSYIPYNECYRLNLEGYENKTDTISPSKSFWLKIRNASLDRIIFLEIAFCDLLGIQYSDFEPRFFIRFPFRDPEIEKKSTVQIYTNEGKREDIQKISNTSKNLLQVILPTYCNIFFFVDERYSKKAAKTLKNIFETTKLAEDFLNEVDNIIYPSGRLPTFEIARFSDKFKKKALPA